MKSLECPSTVYGEIPGLSANGESDENFYKKYT
jgi:hypothetical protein